MSYENYEKLRHEIITEVADVIGDLPDTYLLQKTAQEAIVHFRNAINGAIHKLYKTSQQKRLKRAEEALKWWKWRNEEGINLKDFTTFAKVVDQFFNYTEDDESTK